LGTYAFRFRISTSKRSILLVTVTTHVLPLLPIFSASAWNALSSLSTIALYVSYFLPVLFASLQRRKTGWSDIELAVTEVIAVVWCVFVIGLLCVPPVLPADSPSSIPWSGPIMGMVVVLALVDWTVRVHRGYDPVDTHED
jgi:choline transport protein